MGMIGSLGCKGNSDGSATTTVNIGCDDHDSDRNPSRRTGEQPNRQQQANSDFDKRNAPPGKRFEGDFRGDELAGKRLGERRTASCITPAVDEHDSEDPPDRGHQPVSGCCGRTCLTESIYLLEDTNYPRAVSQFECPKVDLAGVWGTRY